MSDVHREAPDADAQSTADNLAVVRRYVAALRANDRAAAVALYHEEFTLHWFGHRLAGDYVGRAAALRVLGEFRRRTRRRFVDFIDVMAGPRRAAMITVERFERENEHAEFQRVLVFVVKDSLLRECWVYDGDPAKVDRFLNDT